MVTSERLPGLARQLVDLKVDLIVTVGRPPAARAAKAATGNIPIVFVRGSAVESGIVANLARPGANATGVEVLAEQLDAKRLELLKEALPNAGLVTVLWNPATPEGKALREQLDPAARTLGVKLRYVGARSPAELDKALSAAERERADALLVASDPMYSNAARRIAGWATGVRLPAIYTAKNYTEVGGLFSYGADRAVVYRRAATFVDKILKSVKPGDLPVEQPTKFELVINLKTAKALDLAIPPSVLARADEVIQ